MSEKTEKIEDIGTKLSIRVAEASSYQWQAIRHSL